MLIRANDDISCIFLHVLENPRLCDRSAANTLSSGESDGSSTNPNASSVGGKRQQERAHTSACHPEGDSRRIDLKSARNQMCSLYSLHVRT